LIQYENLERANHPFLEDFRASFDRLLQSGWYVLGTEVSSFEREFSGFLGEGQACVGVGNGLDALTLSMVALGLPPGSEILVAANTYIATILAILHAGHRPVLVEPDVRSCNIDPERLESALTHKTRAICVTHLYGKPCRMDRIMPFAQRHGLAVVEDCAQSHGAKLGGRMTGTFGTGCFSFYPTKNLGALGDAGCVSSSDPALIERVARLRNYGSASKYENVLVGYNSRLDEIQAAFLRVKLRRLGEITRHKQHLAELYLDRLPTAVTLPLREDDTEDVFHIFAIRCEERDALRTHLLGHGIQTGIHYPIPPHRQVAMQGILEGHYPISESIHATQLSLPISFATTAEEVAVVCDEIERFFRLGA